MLNSKKTEVRKEEFYLLADKPCALITISGAGGYNTLEVLNHLERFAALPRPNSTFG